MEGHFFEQDPQSLSLMNSKRPWQQEAGGFGSQLRNENDQTSAVGNPSKRIRCDDLETFQPSSYFGAGGTPNRMYCKLLDTSRSSPNSLHGSTAPAVFQCNQTSYGTASLPDDLVSELLLPGSRPNEPFGADLDNPLHYSAHERHPSSTLLSETVESQNQPLNDPVTWGRVNPPNWSRSSCASSAQRPHLLGAFNENASGSGLNPRGTDVGEAHDITLYPSEALEQEPKVDVATTSEKRPLEFDTCFGVIEVGDCTLRPHSFKQGKKVREADLDIQGNLVILRNSQSRQYLGMIHDHAAEMVATLVNTYRACLQVVVKDFSTLSITVCGLREVGDMVGEFLSANDYFLQQPDQRDPSVRYINPQLLLPQGSEFEVSWDEEIDGPSTRIPRLDPTTKSKVHAILDSASGPTKFREVQVSNKLKTRLKIHQEKALAMMVEKESGNITCPKFPSVWVEATDNAGKVRYNNTITGSVLRQQPTLCLGGIIADDMGLGKSLPALALVAGSIEESKQSIRDHEASDEGTLIVTPLSVLPHWENETVKHFKPNAIKVKIHRGDKRTKQSEDLGINDIVLTTYDVVRAEFSKTTRPENTELGPLHTTNWRRVILDEAHIIRNRKTNTFRGVAALHARHRWCITGTPIQNSIEDLGALVEFLRVSPFDDPTTFKNTFVIPVLQERNEGLTRLTSLVKAISLRRTKGSEEDELQLPQRGEVIQPVELSFHEKTIYKLLERSFTLGMESSSSIHSILQTILRLRQVCNHGSDLLPPALQHWLGDALKSADVPSEVLQVHTCESCDGNMEDDFQNISDDSQHLLECLHSICESCLMKMRDHGRPGNQTCPICSDNAARGRMRDQPVHTDTAYTPSSKVRILLRNLAASGEDPIGKPIKSVVFSSWTKMLDLLEKAFKMSELTYQRIDGTKSLQQRRESLKTFKEDSSCKILLASLGTAAVGLDLTAASHVHLLEPGWNPMLERQALDRVHRLGQKNEVKAFRYIVDMENSIEMHVLKVQQHKLRLMSSSFGDRKSASQESTDILKDFLRSLRSSQ